MSSIIGSIMVSAAAVYASTMERLRRRRSDEDRDRDQKHFDKYHKPHLSYAEKIVNHDHFLAVQARTTVREISEAYHTSLLQKRPMKELVLNPGDYVMLPYIVMTNRGAPPGPMFFCGMQVVFDHRVPVGQWRTRR